MTQSGKGAEATIATLIKDGWMELDTQYVHVQLVRPSVSPLALFFAQHIV
jgi:hypothetical protein